MAYKPTYKPPQYNNPDKLPSSVTVAKLSAKTLKGNYFDIKKAMLEERSSLNIIDQTDDTKNTILHYILLNSNLNKNNKYELAKMAIELGAPVDIPNKRFIRPLHLASGQQNKALVRLLLERGADPNSNDDQSMSPLHYAVQPEIIACTPTKMKKIIPDPIPTLAGETDDMFENIFNLMKKDDNITRYIKHIAKIFDSLALQNDMGEDTRKDIGDFIKNAFEKERGVGEKLQGKLIKLRDMIADKTKDKIQANGLEILDIKEDTLNGWGPSAGGQPVIKEEKILPYDESKKIYDEMIDNYNKVINSNKINADKGIKDLKQSIDKFEKHVLKIRDFLLKINNISKFIDNYISQGPGNQIDQNNQDHLAYDEYRQKLNELITDNIQLQNNQFLQSILYPSIRTNTRTNYEIALINGIMQFPNNVNIDDIFFTRMIANQNNIKTYGHVMLYYLSMLLRMYDEIDDFNNYLKTETNDIDNPNQIDDFIKYFYTVIGQHNKSIDIAYACIIIQKTLEIFNDVIGQNYNDIIADNMKDTINKINKMITDAKTNSDKRFKQNQQNQIFFTIVHFVQGQQNNILSTRAINDVNNQRFYIYKVDETYYISVVLNYNPAPPHRFYAYQNPNNNNPIPISQPFKLDDLIMDIDTFKIIVDEFDGKAVSIPSDIYSHL
jgi:hypothetical protein